MLKKQTAIMSKRPRYFHYLFLSQIFILLTDCFTPFAAFKCLLKTLLYVSITVARVSNITSFAVLNISDSLGILENPSKFFKHRWLRFLCSRNIFKKSQVNSCRIIRACSASASLVCLLACVTRAGSNKLI